MLMVIVVRLRCGMEYIVDTYDIDGLYIELRRTSASGKQQLTTLPLEDILDIQQSSLLESPMHLYVKQEHIQSAKLTMKS